MIGRTNVDPFARWFFRLHVRIYAGYNAFLASIDKCAKDYAAMTPAQLDKMVEITGGRQTTQREVIWWAFTHTAHQPGADAICYW